MAKREYIQANKDWLEAKAQSAKPSVRSIVTAHYTGKTIDGKQFDTSRGGVPLAYATLIG